MCEGMLGLVGVFVGFGLSFGAQELKKWLQRRTMRKALLAELKSNLHMLPQKRDIINQIIGHLSAGRLMHGDSVRFATSIYDAHYSTLSWRYSEIERSSLHVIYEYFRTIDSTLASYSDRVIGSSQSESRDDIIGFETTKMTDIAALLTTTEKLISEHLSGCPADVLLLAYNYKEIKDAKFQKA